MAFPGTRSARVCVPPRSHDFPEKPQPPWANRNQTGEGALIDEVDRHYFSTFAAAGAVGVVSGLASAGGSPFGLRAGVGQGLGQSAVAMLDRYLNRLPTITIRAGHRLRIWFTSDVLVPRAGIRP